MSLNNLFLQRKTYNQIRKIFGFPTCIRIRNKCTHYLFLINVRWTPKWIISHSFVKVNTCTVWNKTTSRTLPEVFPNHKRTWSGQEFQWPHNGLCCTTTTWSRWWYIAQVITDLTTVLHASKKKDLQHWSAQAHLWSPSAATHFLLILE